MSTHLFLLSLLAGFQTPAIRDPQPVIPVLGDRFSARIQAIDSSWNITFDTGNRRRILTSANLIHWGARKELPDGPVVVLTDDSLLGGVRIVGITTDHLHIDSRIWGSLKAPLDKVRGVVFQPPGRKADYDRLLDRMISGQGAQDRVVLDNDELTGVLLPSSDPSSNRSLSNAILEEIRLRSAGQQVALPMDKVRALFINPALALRRKPPPRSAWIGLDDGSRLAAAKIIPRTDVVRIQLVCGLNLKTQPADLWRKMCYVRPFRPAAAYLSDLTPSLYKHIPYLGLEQPYGLDRNCVGGRLRASGRIYSKGVGMPSASRLVFSLPEDYRRFQAELAIDDLAHKNGSVVFRVFVRRDENGFQPLFTSEMIRHNDKPTAIDVDISGASHLLLIVEYGEGGHVGDNANWLNARLTR